MLTNVHLRCVGSMSAESSSCRRLSFTVQVCASDPSMCTPNKLRSFCEERGLKNRQEPLKKAIFLPRLANTDHWSRSRVRASFPCTVNPVDFFLFCQPFYISRVSLFLFFFLVYSSVAQTRKNVGPLDCKLCLLRRRSISLSGKTSVAEFMHLILNVFSTNWACFRVCFFYLLLLLLLPLFFYSIHFLSLFLSLSGDFEQLFFVRRNSLGFHDHWDVICSTTTRRVDIGFAFKALGHFAMGKRAGFLVITVFKPCEGGVDRAKTCLVPLNLSLRDVSKPGVPFRPTRKLAQSKHTNRTEGFLMSLGGQPLLSKFLPRSCRCPS